MCKIWYGKYTNLISMACTMACMICMGYTLFTDMIMITFKQAAFQLLWLCILNSRSNFLYRSLKCVVCLHVVLKWKYLIEGYALKFINF